LKHYLLRRFFGKTQGTERNAPRGRIPFPELIRATVQAERLTAGQRLGPTKLETN
jgi:hypothetical protein